MKGDWNDDGYDVFISYRHSSGFYMAELIYSRLIYDGYSVFMDKTMDSGKVEELIKEAIQKSKNFVMVLFPGDLKRCSRKDDWLVKELSWASKVPDINIVPVTCEDFDWKGRSLRGSMKLLKENNAVVMHKDYSLDRDLDKLCDKFLINTDPVRPMVTTEDFFEHNLSGNDRKNIDVVRVDMAFHAGAAWLQAGKKKNILKKILDKNIKLRILINTPEAAENIAKHMRDETAEYVPFDSAKKRWLMWMKDYPQLLEVRECPISLIHVYHNILFYDLEKEKEYGKTHVKYYAYDNKLLDDAFEHELSSYSKYYEIYGKEFEFLWSNSQPLTSNDSEEA